mgnify:CR=1 FL=1
MTRGSDIFKIKSNSILPDKGKVLISEPFLRDANFTRSVVLLIDHGTKGSVGIIMNKPSKLIVNDIVKEFKYLDNIPLFKAGPVSTDTLFYLHTFADIEGALPIGDGIYLNGDFNAIKRYILQGNPIEGKIRFFLGYAGWDTDQLQNEIEENTWIIGNADMANLVNNQIQDLWKTSLEKLGKQYKAWARFPKIPSLN